uniref:Uncharacterized protein n=1 Tax=Melanopsichium pennsylvanicum 4 TaxID=1398559 RepID=A0A077R0L5_9BASI|nr:conserved hypothetical protein [Melanopsichium pennsylvanicum 4]
MMVDDATAERLANAASAAATLTSSSSLDIQILHNQALSHRSQVESHQDTTYLNLAPTFLHLHQQATSSKQLLTSLETFLSTFQSDLSTLSTHISALQSTSHQIDSRLDATKDVEIQLANFLSHIALSPRVVDLFFDTDPETWPELWSKAVRQLEKVLDATSSSATLVLPPTSSTAAETTGGEKRIVNIGDIQAVNEVRSVAEACRNMVASKLRTYLTTPHTAIKSSVTTNLQVLQTSVLLRHHRGMYAFLARQMPRVAIDVQRNYVQCARLYFETAFRRYTRSLGVIRKRWNDSNTSISLITDPIPNNSSSGSGNYATDAKSKLQSDMTNLARLTATSSSSSNTTNFLPPRLGGDSNTAQRPPFDSQNSSAGGIVGDAEAMSTNSSSTSSGVSLDPWFFSPHRMQYSKLDAPNAATVLGYFADEPSFKACPENLFRSLGLVMVDNACSEYCFITRFFEGISTSSSSFSDDDNEDDQITTKNLTDAEKNGMAPEESASVTGSNTSTRIVSEQGEAEQDQGPEASVVQLSLVEQAKLKGRGASEEMLKQIYDPSLNTFSSFTRTLLSSSSSFGSSSFGSSASTLAASATSVVSGGGISINSNSNSGSGGGGGSNVGIGSISGPSGYFSLLSMLQINDSLLELVQTRLGGGGCSVLEGVLMGFKIATYPLVKRFLDDQIAAVTHLHRSSDKNDSTTSSSGMMWGFDTFAF